MKKETKIITFIVIGMVIALGMVLFFFGGAEKTICKVNFEREFIVENGVAENGIWSETIKIPEDGEYRFRFTWNCEGGIITGACLTDVDGKVLTGLTGECVDAEMMPMYFTKGDYRLTYIALLSSEEFNAFVADTLHIEDYEEEPYDYAKKGAVKSTHSYEIVKLGSTDMVGTIAVVIGLILGGVMALIFCVISRDNTNSANPLEIRYDERQLAARGKAYQIGFFTAIAYFIALAFCDVLEAKIPAEDCIVIFIGVLISLFAFVAYCIWEDAYYALNEKRKVLYIIVGIVGIMNLLIGIVNVVTGIAFTEGVLNFQGTNLICGCFMLAVGAILVIKGLAERKEEK